MATQSSLNQFFSSSSFAVVGASNNRSKFGNRILRKYLEHQLKVFPIHPQEEIIEGLRCLKSVEELPEETKSISIITPPPITEKVVQEAIEKGIQNIWMQPGAESEKAMAECKKVGINLIADGSCLLLVLG